MQVWIPPLSSFDFIGTSLDLRSFVYFMIPPFDFLGASLDLRSGRTIRNAEHEQMYNLDCLQIRSLDY